MVKLGDDNLVLFDGACGLCDACVRFTLRHGAQRRFTYVPIQSPEGRRLCRQQGENPDHPRSLWLFKDGKTYQRSDAVLELARGLDGAWRFLALLRLVPRPLRNWAYDLIARARRCLPD